MGQKRVRLPNRGLDSRIMSLVRVTSQVLSGFNTVERRRPLRSLLQIPGRIVLQQRFLFRIPRRMAIVGRRKDRAAINQGGVTWISGGRFGFLIDNSWDTFGRLRDSPLSRRKTGIYSFESETSLFRGKTKKKRERGKKWGG